MNANSVLQRKKILNFFFEHRIVPANGVRHQRVRGQSNIARRVSASETPRGSSREDQQEVNTPRTPENYPTNVPLVDLITPLVPAGRARRPLQVDLTCDLDDEVFVVLVHKI